MFVGIYSHVRIGCMYVHVILVYVFVLRGRRLPKFTNESAARTDTERKAIKQSAASLIAIIYMHGAPTGQSKHTV